MTIAQRIAMNERASENARLTSEFGQFARFFVLAKGHPARAGLLADEARAIKVRDIFKSAQTAGTLTSWSQLADYRLMVSGFANSLQNIGVFDGMLPAMRRVPLSVTVGAVSVAAAGFYVSEGSAKPATRLSITSGTLEPLKAVALLPVSNELLRIGDPEVQSLFTSELQNACVAAIDSQFITILTSGVSIGTSVGQTAVSVAMISRRSSP
jgi:hypothetical protein